MNSKRLNPAKEVRSSNGEGKGNNEYMVFIVLLLISAIGAVFICKILQDASGGKKDLTVCKASGGKDLTK